MSGIALSIVLASAFLHAGWNYLLKKSEQEDRLHLVVSPDVRDHLSAGISLLLS